MTGEEWDACRDLRAMLWAVQGKASDRKFRLFSCACWRRNTRHASVGMSALIAVIERCVDGLATAEDVQTVLDSHPDDPDPELLAMIAGSVAGTAAYFEAYLAGESLLVDGISRGDVVTFGSLLISKSGLDIVRCIFGNPFPRTPRSARRAKWLRAVGAAGVMSAMGVVGAGLVGMFAGNPFRPGERRPEPPDPGANYRPVTFDPAWLTSDVVALARGIYAERAFDHMPILADALQDAGCDNEDALRHCRGGGPHDRGCWVVDLALGKE